jgi:hypothetical protein
MERIPYRRGEPVPIGFVLVQDPETRERFWVYPNDLEVNEPGPPLSEDLVARIRAFKAILGDAESSTVEQTLFNLSTEAHPEREVAVWERIARAYRNEVTARNVEDPERRGAIFGVLLLASMGMGEREIVSSNPKLKTVPDIGSILKRFVELA